MTQTLSFGPAGQGTSLIGCGPMHCQAGWQREEWVNVQKFGASGFRLLSTKISFSLYMENAMRIDNPHSVSQVVDGLLNQQLGFEIGPLNDSFFGGAHTCTGPSGAHCSPTVTVGVNQTTEIVRGLVEYFGEVELDSLESLWAFSGGGTWGIGTKASGSASVSSRPNFVTADVGGTFGGIYTVAYEYCNFRTDASCDERLPEPSSSLLVLAALAALPLARRLGARGLARKRSL